jgi:hypothetical protein
LVRAAPDNRPSTRALFLPLVLALALASLGFLPRIRSNPILLGSCVGTGAVLLVWWALLRFPYRGRTLKLDIVLRPEHYVQLVAQLAIYVYWAFYWSPIQDAAALIVAQLVFAYAFDMLLAWSRRETYTLGFGPFPIIFSINLFLRFRDDLFVLQFVLVAAAFLAKELIRWNKDGRRVHIFNPSSFPLALASVILLLTHTTHLTWGVDIATELFRPPQIYLFLFLVSLPGQFRFGITTMSLAAVVTAYGVGLAYFAATGTYLFIDSHIPIAVFLGMLLLITDPATAPRTELGRIIFGAMYGASTVGLYALLDSMGAPTFYDKLLQVPILNLSVQMIDRAARSPKLAWLDPARLGRSLRPMRRNLAYTSVWVVVFTAMSFAQGVGDTHRGHFIPFWQKACAENRRGACETLTIMESTYCEGGSAWACNDLGVLLVRKNADSPSKAATAFQRACSLGLAAGCRNGVVESTGIGELTLVPPRLADYPIILNEGKGPLASGTPVELYQRACEQGWLVGCESAAFAHLRGEGTTRDPARAVDYLDRACRGGLGSACSNVGFMFKSGDGVPRDDARALGYLKKACDQGFNKACRWLEEQRSATN